MNEIEKYIQQFPDEVQEILRTIRKLIRDNAPDSEEGVAYGRHRDEIYWIANNFIFDFSNKR